MWWWYSLICLPNDDVGWNFTLSVLLSSNVVMDRLMDDAFVLLPQIRRIITEGYGVLGILMVTFIMKLKCLCGTSAGNEASCFSQTVFFTVFTLFCCRWNSRPIFRSEINAVSFVKVLIGKKAFCRITNNDELRWFRSRWRFRVSKKPSMNHLLQGTITANKWL